ncbi:MAG: hypothetical protein A2017_11040 [Lentisphaerae bacterium GWF2_44_16]|nr:MAG: hypothetical protein A2017_11040 [Lentisphaerae bacterium GWF2_44_16]
MHGFLNSFAVVFISQAESGLKYELFWAYGGMRKGRKAPSYFPGKIFFLKKKEFAVTFLISMQIYV